MAGNKLTALTQEIGSLRKLQCLAADNNMLSSIPGPSPPLQDICFVLHSHCLPFDVFSMDFLICQGLKKKKMC